MNTISPETRNRNLLTFILLVLFALGLCGLVLWSMHLHARRQGEAGHPSPDTSLRLQSGLSSAA